MTRQFSNADLKKILNVSLLTLSAFTVVLSIFICCVKKGIPSLTFLAVSMACLIGGGVFGFLFGLPRTEKNRYKKEDDHASKENFYSDNTNLEEISDWLTKIIVGLTLVKFNTLLNWINSAALSMSKTFNSSSECKDCHTFYAFSYAVMVLYFLAGAAIAYLWTRVMFNVILTDNAISLRQRIENQKNELKMLNPHLIKADGFRAIAGGNMDIANFRDHVNSENSFVKRPIVNPSDLQSGRWGGIAKKSGYSLDATVKNLPQKDLFSLTIIISKTADANPYLIVAIFLHDTFPRQVVYIQPDEKTGIAKLNLTSYEAFTVGALLQDGTTLELDLNKLPDLPEGFYWS